MSDQSDEIVVEDPIIVEENHGDDVSSHHEVKEHKRKKHKKREAKEDKNSPNGSVSHEPERRKKSRKKKSNKLKDSAGDVKQEDYEVIQVEDSSEEKGKTYNDKVMKPHVLESEDEEKPVHAEKKKKSKKNHTTKRSKPKRPLNESINLGALEVIEVDSDDEPNIKTDEIAIDISLPSEGEFQYQLLPPEVFLKIWNYLDIYDIGRAAQVCKWWNEFSFHEDIWKTRAKGWGLRQSQMSREQNILSKRYFVRKYHEHERREAARIAEEKRRKEIADSVLRNQKRQAKADKCMSFLKKTLFSRVGDYLTVIFVLLGVIFIPLKLDHKIDWPWAVVIIPWYLLVAQLVIVVTCYDASQIYYRGLMSFDAAGYKLLFWKFVFRKRTFRDIVYCGMLNFVSFFILMGVKLTFRNSENETPYEWWAVWIPIWVYVCYLIQVPFTGGLGRSVKRVSCDNCCARLGIFLAIAVVSIPTLIFIFLKIEDKIHWPLWTVFIPIWIIFGILACAGVFFGIWLCCEHNGLTVRELAVYYSAIFLWFGSLFTWFLVLCFQVQKGKIGWSASFAPLIFWAGSTLIGCGVADVYFKYH